MLQDNRTLFLQHARSQLPREACGLLIIEKGREVLILCENTSVLDDQFEISAIDFAQAEERGEIVGIVHSHPFTNPLPSEADLVSCEATGVPWFIVAVGTGEWYEFKPSGYKAPLVGRSWAHGSLDCYSLVRDYYKETLNLDLPDYDREFEWWLKGKNLYADNFKSQGFEEVPLKEIQQHDLILMQIRSPVINHGAIYLGNDVILHHCHRRLSSRDVYSGYWLRNTVKVARYRGL